VSILQPANKEAERSILGAILLSQGVQWQDAAATLSPDDFFLDSHRRIFLRLGELARSSQPADLVTLAEELTRHRELEAVGGVTYLASLTDNLPRLANIEHYVRIVKDYAAKRALLHLSVHIQSRASEPGETTESILSDAQRALHNLVEPGRSGFTRVGETCREQFPDTDSFNTRFRQLRGAETGFRAYDNLTCGLHRGEMVVVAARPGMGKTSMALNVAVHVAKREQVVGIFSLEMTKAAVAVRLLCSEARVDSHRLRGGFCGRDDVVKMLTASTIINNLQIFIDDQVGQTPETMLAKASKLKRDCGGLGLLVVDYLQLMNIPKWRDGRVQEVSYISRTMKEMARELDIPLILVSQLNRAIEERGGEPRLSDLRESGQIEQDADVVLFLWREQQVRRARHSSRGNESNGLVGPDNTVHCKIAKQRNGPIGSFDLVFEGRCCSFGNLEQGTATAAAAPIDSQGEEDELNWEE